MVLVQIQQLSSSKVLLQNAAKLAVQLGKSFGVLTVTENNSELETLLGKCKIVDYQIFVKDNSKSLLEHCEAEEASFLFIQMPNSQSNSIRRTLKDCRDLRIPYVLHKDIYAPLDTNKVLLPVGFLEEELEKAQFAAAFGRFCGSEVVMLPANDYGSKAASNATKMKDLFDKFDFSYKIEKATKNSFKVEMEAVMLAQNKQAGLVIVSASRDYGLDDILFGPKEQHVIGKSTVPVLIVNPRADLYALCD